MLAEWLSQIESEIAPETWKTYQGYCSNHFLPFFESADRITASSAEDYSRMRLRAVTRSTVAKELSALRNFLELGGAPARDRRSPYRPQSAEAIDGHSLQRWQTRQSARVPHQ